jgi:hypothetical protein
MLKALALGVLALFLAASAGCPPAGRFASCDNDSQCGAVDGGKLICYNLRCVECHYDGDCTDGRVCSNKSTCESLDSRVKEEEPPPPPTSLEECAKRCKGNAACSDSCRAQFK